jgi:uncharacterized protein YxjI
MRRRSTSNQAKRYQMRQKMVSVGDDFWIEDEQGVQMYHVDGKALTIGDKLIFKDVQGAELYKIREKLLKVKDTMEIEAPDGNTVATIKKDLINVLKDHFAVKVMDGPDLDVTGNIIDHDYHIKEGRQEVARVSKKFFRVRDSYGVEVQPGQNEAFILAIAVALDMMAHN